jgi:beta,beta-carotene 9',10'-dioxygenase
VKVDTADRTAQVWAAEGCHPGEPVFVPAPGAQAEDDGVVLAVVLDEHKGASFLLVLDARSFAEVGRAEVPHHIPAGFHGQYLVR